jgi:GH25 family lysozyme M1 (1,4-beta-N-acetylmuramidase)
VVAVERVSGSRWRDRCAGEVRSGRSWYRITIVGNRSVLSRYDRKVVYGPTGLFRVTSPEVPMAAACDRTRVRTGTGSSATTRLRLDEGTPITVAGSLRGTRWQTECTGTPDAGHGWYRVVAIDGTSVSKRFGVPVLYIAKGQVGPLLVSSTGDPLNGIDVSHWQGTIDWAAVAGSGQRFAFLKASDDTDYEDPTYQANRAAARANGVLVGAYHFARPDDSAGDAVAEADHFVDTASWRQGEMLPVLDLERTGGLSVSELKAWVRAFLGRVKARTGIKAMIYTSPSFWSSNMGDTTEFATDGHRLWVAHWTDASSPRVPADGWGGRGWTMWQITSDGSLPGIEGRVDLDRYRLDTLETILVN